MFLLIYRYGLNFSAPIPILLNFDLEHQRIVEFQEENSKLLEQMGKLQDQVTRYQDQIGKLQEQVFTSFQKLMLHSRLYRMSQRKRNAQFSLLWYSEI